METDETDEDTPVFKKGRNPLEHWTKGEYEDPLACSIDWRF